MRAILLLVIACHLSIISFTQTALDTLRYVDLHIQPSFKAYYREIDQPSRMSDPTWKSEHNVSMMNWNGERHQTKFKSRKGFSGFEGKNSYPQASHDLLQRSHASILLSAFSPFEHKLVSDKDHVYIFGIIKQSMRRTNHQNSKLSMKRQDVIASGNPLDEYNAELRFLIEQEQQPAGFDRKIVVIKNRAQLEDAVQKKYIALIPTVEGLSSFYGKENWFFHNHFDCMQRNNQCYEELIGNIRKIKQSEYVPFLIAPAHLAWNRVVSQAKAFDSKPLIRRLLSINAKSTSFREKVFNKHSQGIVDTIYNYSPRLPEKTSKCVCDRLPRDTIFTMGPIIVKELLSDKIGKPILIDMRHMDIQARIDYIELVKEIERTEGRKIPVIVSHTAVSGKNLSQALFFGDCPVLDRYKELLKPIAFYRSYGTCLKEKGIHPIDMNTTGWFHPWSLNVFDEEIAAVYRTNGILGLSIEERVLGTGAFNYNRSHKRKLKNFLKDHGFSKGMIDTFRIAEPLMRNILYVAEHSGEAGKIKSWEHMAIGSDFDGIINPIDICPTAADIPKLYQALTICLPLFADFIGKTNLLCGYEKNVEVLLNKLFYQNGERFVMDNYK